MTLPELAEIWSLSPDAVLLTYESRSKQNDGSERCVLRSSIWKHNGKQWQMLFHQGTIARRQRSA